MRIRCGQGCGRGSPGWVASGILVLMILAGSARAEEAVVYQPDPNTQIIQGSDTTVTVLTDGSGNVLESVIDKGE